MTLPSPALTLRIARELDLVLAFLPWMRRPGVVVDATPTPNRPALFYRWDAAAASTYIVVPPSWDTDDVALRRLVRHECGHEWIDELARRRGGSYEPWADLGIDPAHPQRHEIGAEIVARVMGEQPSYPDLEPLSRPTPERVAFVERSGAVADTLAEEVALAQDIAAWEGRDDIPSAFLAWRPLYQRWLELRVLRPLRLR